MSANFAPGDDGDWTDAATREVAARFFEKAMHDHRQAFAVRWDEQLQVLKRDPSLGRHSTVAQFPDYRYAGGLQTLEDYELTRAMELARRLRGLPASALPPK